MKEGAYQLSVPINIDSWFDVYGGQSAALFMEALNDLENIGILFGSAGGRGHGVCAVTPSTFTLINLKRL